MKTLAELNDAQKMDLFGDVVRNWGREPAEYIAQRNDVSRGTVQYVCGKLRKKGFDLPRMMIIGWLTEERIEELKKLFAMR